MLISSHSDALFHLHLRVQCCRVDRVQVRRIHDECGLLHDDCFISHPVTRIHYPHFLVAVSDTLLHVCHSLYSTPRNWIYYSCFAYTHFPILFPSSSLFTFVFRFLPLSTNAWFSPCLSVTCWIVSSRSWYIIVLSLYYLRLFHSRLL